MTAALLQRRNLLLLPAVMVLALLFLGPMVYFFVVSFFKVSLFNLVPEWNLGNYRKIGAEYLLPIAYTIGIGAIISVVATIAGYIVAHVIWRNGGTWGAFLLGATLLTLFGGTRSLMMGNFIESQFGLRMNMPLGAARCMRRWCAPC